MKPEQSLMELLCEDVPTAIETCWHRVPYPRGWSRASDAERKEKWPDYCEPCPKCRPAV